MAEKKTDNEGFQAYPEDKKIIDDMMKIHYTKSKSEVIRMLIREGAKTLLKGK